MVLSTEYGNRYYTGVIWQFPKIGGPQYRPWYTIILIMGTPQKMVPLILRNPHIGMIFPFALLRTRELTEPEDLGFSQE